MTSLIIALCLVSSLSVTYRHRDLRNGLTTGFIAGCLFASLVVAVH